MEPTIDTSMPEDKISGDADRDERKDKRHIKVVRSYLNEVHRAITKLELWCQMEELRCRK